MICLTESRLHLRSASIGIIRGLPPGKKSQALWSSLCQKEPQYAKTKAGRMFSSSGGKDTKEKHKHWPAQHGTKELCTNIDARLDLIGHTGGEVTYSM